MNDDVAAWLRYAGESLKVARLCFGAGLLNPAVQNAQQAVEKALKAILLLRQGSFEKTHSILRLHQALALHGVATGFSEDECDLLDSVYIGSKYPSESVVPNAPTDAGLALQCIRLAEAALREGRTHTGL